MKKISLCAPDCKYLDPKEKDQKNYERHYCKKFNKQVKHEACHPHLVKIEGCTEPYRRTV
jgi:hypothetical protein